MHLHGFREADRFPRQPFDPRAQREMLAFDSLRLPFARTVLLRVQLPRGRTPVIRVKARDPKRFQQLLQLQEHGIFAPPKHIGQDLARLVIDGVPQPPGLLLLADILSWLQTNRG
jgi:hypothetical protein